jgi:ribonuclease HI
MNKSGQHLAAAVVELEKYLKKHRGGRRFELTFRWSAGHTGIGGNEDADKEAKAAARNAAQLGPQHIMGGPTSRFHPID